MNLDQLIASLPAFGAALEWIAAGMGLICLIGGLVGLLQAYGDRRIAKGRTTSPRWPIRVIIASGHVRHERINVLVQGGFGTLEVWGLLTPDPVRPALLGLWVGSMIVFTAMQLLLTYSSLADRVDRARIMRAVQVSLKGDQDAL